MVRFGVYVLLLVSACASAHATPSLPGTFGSGEPLPPPVAPESGAPAPTPPVGAVPDPGAEADFRDAKAKFDAGDREGARAALEGFVAHHPQHPFRPSVDLMLARLALLRGDAAGAKALLEPLVAAPGEAGVGSGARYYLGLAEVRLAENARGRDLLLPFLPPAGATSPGPEALVELRGALAEATAALGEIPAALELLDGYAEGGREPEKAFARLRASELGAELSPDAAARAYRAASARGLARAVLGAKAAGYLRTQGDAGGAAAVDEETAAARRAVGFEDAAASRGAGSRGGDPGRLGLALAMSGKFQPVGEAAMRAALLAAGALAKNGSVGLYLRDTGPEPDRAGSGVAALARDEDVIGIVAAADRKSVPPALGAATDNGVPTLALDDAAPGAATTAFQLVHAPEARAAALARAALARGARDFGLLGPDSAAGKRLRDAFRREVTAGGGRVVAEAAYPAGATSFGQSVASFKKNPPQAVFVADSAERLELVAPALAAADLWPAPWGAPRQAAAPGKPRPRNVLVLSTANDLSPRLIQNAGRYVQGALLAPGFYVDAADPRARAFAEAYRAAYGTDPHATEAYAFDAVNAFRAATAGGAHTRGEVLKALAGGTFDGLTGAMRFSPEHGRADSPRLYVVDGEEIKEAR